MGRIRTIKPEFPQSESIGRLTRESRLFFLLLFTVADDEGRCRAAERLLLGQLYPYDEDMNSTNIRRMLDELSTNGRVIVYESGGATYLQIKDWRTHQKIDKPSASHLPPPPDLASIRRTLVEPSPSILRTFGDDSNSHPRAIDEPSTTDLGPRILDLGASINSPHTPHGGDDKGGDDSPVPAIAIHAMPTPEAVKAAAGWQQPANPPPVVYTDPQTGSTAGKPRFSEHSVQLYPNGTILADSATFRRFWKAYPKNSRRNESADAWNRAIIAGADPEHIIASVAVESSLRRPPEEKQFLPSADKWLDDRRYETVAPARKQQQEPEDPEMAAIMAERRRAAEQAEAERQARSKAEMDALFASPVYEQFKQQLGITR